MIYRSNGFSNNLPVVELKTGQPFNLGKDLSVFVFRKRGYVELTSVASLVEKDLSHIIKWAEKNSVAIHEFKNAKNSKKIQAFSEDSFISFLTDEYKIDNPSAEKFLNRCGRQGIKSACREAEKQGKDYIEVDGIKSHFIKQGDDYYLSFEDLAELCGVSPEQLKKDLNSEEFQSFLRHRID